MVSLCICYRSQLSIMTPSEFGPTSNAHPKHKKATIRDVAERADVSPQTVSRVINGYTHVSKKARLRVQRAIEELNYRPNRAAQSLVTRQSRILAVITFGATHYGPAQMVANVQTEARARGYNLILSNLSSTEKDEIRKAMESISGSLVDGLVFITPVEGASYADLATLCRGVPYVQIDVELGVQQPSVVIDQRMGYRLATEHLIMLGHQQIAHISGPLNWFGAQARLSAWRDMMQANGYDSSLTVEGDWTPAGGYRATMQLIESGQPFTALAVGNDHMALGALHALRQQGKRVPEDVSVVGFDDIPEAAYFAPPLTTVRQDFGALGKQSVEYLVSLINKPETPPHQRVLMPQLIVRESTRPR